MKKNTPETSETTETLDQAVQRLLSDAIRIFPRKLKQTMVDAPVGMC